MKIKVQAYNKKAQKVKKKFIKSCRVLKMGDLGFLMLVDNKTKNYTVDMADFDKDSKTLLLDISYTDKNNKDCFVILEMLGISGSYEVLTKWRKSTLEVYLLKKSKLKFNFDPTKGYFKFD